MIAIKEQQGAALALFQRRREATEFVIGKSFKPSSVRFTAALPKTRSAKVLRRAIRATALGNDPGDLSSLEGPGALDAVRSAR